MSGEQVDIDGALQIVTGAKVARDKYIYILTSLHHCTKL
jgi:hypothetical protein